MARNKADRRRRSRADTSPPKPPQPDPVLHAAIKALHWRLSEGANRIADAQAALLRDQRTHAMDHLLALEPLVFEAERILSATFLLARETQGRMRS